MTELIEAVARAIAREKRIEICSDASYRHSTFGPLAQAALTAITDAGYRIVKDEPTPAMINRGVDFAIKAKLGGDYLWPDYIKELFCTMIAAAPGDEK